MKEIHYRIVFRKLYSKNTKRFVQYLIKEFKFAKEKAEGLLKFSPAVLYDSPNKNRIKMALKDLKTMGASLSVHTVIKDEKLPFLIDNQHLKWISKLLNMTLRTGVDTTLVYVVVQPMQPGEILIPLTGREDEIEKSFRQSDSVYAIDDNKLLFLGFATDHVGFQILIPKIVKAIEKIVKNKVIIETGEAIFPEDGYSFYELIHEAQERLHRFVRASEKTITIPIEERTSEALGLENRNLNGINIYSTCFTKARGAFFYELLVMDQEILWYGLRRLPISDQKLFFLRLPYNYSLIKFLSEKIKTQAPAKTTPNAEHKLKDLISKMKVEKNLIERKKNQSSIITKLNRLAAFSTIPSVALQVYNLAMDPTSDIDDIQKIIQLDQALTLKLLKIVNSAFYGLSQKVNSVKEAVIVIGTDEIMNMAFGLSISESFKASNLEKLIDPDELWKHSVGTALIGKYLCSNMKAYADEGIFTACILHDIGKLFLIENFPDLYRRILEDSEQTGVPAYDLEEEIFGNNHGVIGGIIAKKWNLPDSLVQAISFHHHPSSSTSHSRLAAMTGFANYLSHMALDSADDKNNNANAKGLLKDHLDILETIFENFTSKSIDEAVENTRCFLEENNDFFSIIS